MSRFWREVDDELMSHFGIQPLSNLILGYLICPMHFGVQMYKPGGYTTQWACDTCTNYCAYAIELYCCLAYKDYSSIDGFIYSCKSSVCRSYCEAPLLHYKCRRIPFHESIQKYKIRQAVDCSLCRLSHTIYSVTIRYNLMPPFKNKEQIMYYQLCPEHAASFLDHEFVPLNKKRKLINEIVGTGWSVPSRAKEIIQF